jgi:hypothetical protein
MDARGFVMIVAHALGAGKAEREAVQEYNLPTYGNGSFKSILIGVAVFVAIVIGFFLLFT